MIDISNFDGVFDRWRGLRASFNRPFGNVGDRLIDLSTYQLFHHYGIEMVEGSDFDVSFWAGGGNMGSLYPATRRLRDRAAMRAQSLKKPFVILPQSWFDADDVPFDLAFAREKHSIRYCPSARLAPDLALAFVPDFEIPSVEKAKRDIGYFFRTDKERFVGQRDNFGDPAAMARTPKGYILLVSHFRHVHTDRLHFAIAALIAGRQVTLYDNSYHKNKGMWECWLRDLGCEFLGG